VLKTADRMTYQQTIGVAEAERSRASNCTMQTC